MAISLVVERPTPKNMRQFGISTNKKWKKNLLKAPLSRSSLLYQYESPIGCFSSACYLDRLDPWELDRLDNCKWHPRCPTSAPKKNRPAAIQPRVFKTMRDVAAGYTHEKTNSWIEEPRVVMLFPTSSWVKTQQHHQPPEDRMFHQIRGSMKLSICVFTG